VGAWLLNVVKSPRMGDDVNTVWAVVSGSLLVVMHGGVVMIVEGMTRRRTVSTGAARHLGGVIGAVLGVVVCGYALGVSSGNQWYGSDGFFLLDVDLAQRVTADSATTGSLIFQQIAISSLFGALVMAALAERATFVAHVLVGLVAGGFAVPLTRRSLETDGILGSITIGDSGFVDSAAATLFTMSGWFALVGAMVIGPRLGRIGPSGNFRAIPGKSAAMVSAGTVVFLAGSIGLSALNMAAWSDDVATASLAVVIAGSAGATSAALLGLRSVGFVDTSVVSRGFLVGVVSVSGSLLDVDPAPALAIGAIGGVIAFVGVAQVERWQIDDPVGVVGVFGAGGVWASLIANAFDSNQFFAQILGQLIVAAWSIVVAGIVFGGLRVLRVLRVRPELEIVGLDT
jgi:Amt family ammonium transporter